MNQGKYVICAMVVVGLGMAVFAWWARYTSSRRVLSVLGPDVAVAVRNGEKVELLTLATGPSDTTESNSQEIRNARGETVAVVLEAQEITDAPGLIHARHHLLHERGFSWDDVASGGAMDAEQPHVWSIGLRFTHTSSTATWLLDLDTQQAFIVESDIRIGISPIAPSLKAFIAQLPQTTAAASGP